MYFDSQNDLLKELKKLQEECELDHKVSLDKEHLLFFEKRIVPFKFFYFNAISLSATKFRVNGILHREWRVSRNKKLYRFVNRMPLSILKTSSLCDYEITPLKGGVRWTLWFCLR